MLNGDGLDLELLEEANVASMDAVLALTDDDKTNILACVRAKTEGAKMVVALVNDASLIGLIAPMGIDAYVNPRVDDGVLDPALRPPRAHPRGLFDRRRRGRGDRGAGARHLGDRRQDGPRGRHARTRR